MVAFRSGRRPSGESLKKMNEAKRSKIEKGLMKLPNKFDPKGKKITGERKPFTEFKKAGGRIGLKAGSKGCKLAMKGKGKAYGKNS